MKAILVWPKFESFSFWNFEKVCKMTGAKYMTPPLGLLTVAALLPEDWELRLVDENVKEICDADYEWADFAFIGSKIVSRHRALELVRASREAGITVAVGGPDATLHPKVYREAGANFLCLGEGELTIPRLLADLDANVDSGDYQPKEMADITQTPPPRFDLINFRDYLYVGVQYSRGCPYNCEFCNVIDLFDGYRTKTVPQVLKELDLLYELGYRGQLDFFDDNLAGHMKQAKVLLQALADWQKAHKYPYMFSTSVTLNIAKDDELLKLMRDARFKYLLVGIETPSPEALKLAQKQQNVGFSITEAVDRIYKIAGATVHSGFLLGLDGEPADIGDQIIKCIDDTQIPWVMAGMVYPLPGTQLSRRLDREGRLFPKARTFDDGRVRDQISAGIQFRTERPAPEVLDDLIRVLDYTYEPKGYLARCAEVACRIDTVANLKPGWRILFRNLRTFVRLCARMTFGRKTVWPFWKAFWKVVFKNFAGMETLITLSVLFVHFQGMMPYCMGELKRQRAEILEMGEDAWFEENLREPTPVDTEVADAKAPDYVGEELAA